MLTAANRGRGRRRSAPVRTRESCLPLVIVTLLLNAACSTVAGPGATPAPVEDHGAGVAAPESDAAIPVQAETRAATPGPDTEPAPGTPSTAREPAVLALAEAADEKLRDGDPESAAAVLERALRLAPADALLWHRLARVRLGQGRWQLAIALARKSDTLASANPELRAANARLMARAQQLSGAGE